MLKTEVITPKHSGEVMVAKETDTRIGPAWLHWDRCPIIPNVRWRSGNSQNTWSFGIHWLVFRAWTMDSPDIGFEVTLDDMGLQVRLRIPYLITGLFVPLFPWRFHQMFWRKPNRNLACPLHGYPGCACG